MARGDRQHVVRQPTPHYDLRRFDGSASALVQGRTGPRDAEGRGARERSMSEGYDELTPDAYAELDRNLPRGWGPFLPSRSARIVT
jgi:hypothetical protein